MTFFEVAELICIYVCFIVTRVVKTGTGVINNKCKETAYLT